MRSPPAPRKLEIIRLVEQSHLQAGSADALAMLGILPMTFYRWYARLQTGGPEALEDKPSRPRRVWNKIPEEVREQIVELALDEPEGLSPREVATRFTDMKKYFVSEASVYRLLKAHDPDHQPGFHRRHGRRVQGQDDGTEPAMADRLHVPEGDRLGLVLSVDHPRRLLPLHHRLEAVHDDEG